LTRVHARTSTSACPHIRAPRAQFELWGVERKENKTIEGGLWRELRALAAETVKKARRIPRVGPKPFTTDASYRRDRQHISHVVNGQNPSQQMRPLAARQS
jgi:hypothetical protein